MISNYFRKLYKHTSTASSKYYFSLFEEQKDAKLLDCGCWDGVNTKRYGSLVRTTRLYGIEIEKNQLKKAQQAGITARYGNLNDPFPFPAQSFDVAAAYHVIEHLVNVKGFVQELYRVLKKGGYVLLGTPNLASWHNVAALIMGQQPFSGPTIMPNFESSVKMVAKLNKQRAKSTFADHTAPSLDHVKVMTLKTLIRLCKKVGFKVEIAKGFGYYPLPPFLAGAACRLDPYHSHYVILKIRK